MRKGKISVENLSGGELTSAPLLSTPTKYSRLLKNFYINSEGHIKKVPGYSAISNMVSGIRITSGLDFKKTDGTSIKLLGGQIGGLGALLKLENGLLVTVKNDFANTNVIHMSQIGDNVVVSNNQDVPFIYDGTTQTEITMPGSTSTVLFTGTGLNDLEVELATAAAVVYEVEIDGIASATLTPTFTGTGVDDLSCPTPNYSGGAAATFDVVIDSAGSGDTLKYNLNGGEFTAGVALSTGTTQEYVNYRNNDSGVNWPAEQALTGTTNAGGITIGAGATGNNLTNEYQVYLTQESGNNFIYGVINGSQTARIQAQPDLWYSLAGFGFSIKIPTAYFSPNARNISFRFAKRAADIGIGYVKSATTTANSQDDQYEAQIRWNDGSSLGYRWRKNGGDWTSKTVALADFMGYDTIDSTHSIRFKNWTGNTNDDVYLFQVDGAGTPDTFKWRKNAEAYTANVPITAGSMLLKEGIYISFASFTGHTNADSWAFAPTQDTVKYNVNGGDYTTDQPITGALQLLDTGIQFKFSSINGHTLADKWTIPVSQTLRFGKSYTYKNRTWILSSDKMMAYHSVLSLPTDFSGDGSGYLDFRYVIPQGDELVDISSFLNYLIFFFKNHIVVYSGTDPTAEGDFVIYQIITDIGLLAPYTVIPVGSDIFFLTTKGVKGMSQLITAGALNVASVSGAIDDDIVTAVEGNTSGIYASAHYPTLGLLMFLVGTTIFIYNYRQKAWSRIVIPSDDNVAKILSMFQTADGYLYMGGYDYLFDFDPVTVPTYNFNGKSPAYQWTGPMWKATTAESMFLTEMVMRLASTAACSLTLKVRAVGFDTEVEDQDTFNEQVLEVSAITTLGTVFNFVRAPLYGGGKYVQVDITESPVPVSNNDIEIAAIEIQGELGMS